MARNNALFPDRPTRNVLLNALKDIQDFGSGISTLASSIPSFVSGEAQLPTLPQLGKAIAQGYAQSYGQQEGFNPGVLVDSLTRHPLNILDVLPAAAVVKGGKLAGTVGKAGKAGRAFDAMGEIPRYTGTLRATGQAAKTIKKTPARQVGEALQRPVLTGEVTKTAPRTPADSALDTLFTPAGTAATDDVANYARRSQSFTPAQMNTWGHIYGSMINKYKKPQQEAVMKIVKDKMGIASTKDLKPEQMWDVVDTLRQELPSAVEQVTGKPISQAALKRIDAATETVKQTAARQRNLQDLDVARLVQGFRTPEYSPKMVPSMRQAKKAFTGSVLTQPLWVIGNRIGDAMFALGAGRNPAELYSKGFSNLTKGIVNPEDLGGFYRRAYKDVDIPGNLGKLSDINKRWDDFFFKTLEGNLEQATRRGAFYKNLEGLAKQSLKSKGEKASGKALEAETRRLSRLGTKYDEAVKRTRQQFGDYRDFPSLDNIPVIRELPDWAKQLAGEVLASPFIKWPREATKITAHQAVNNPFIFQGQRAASRLGGQFQQQQEEFVNDLGYQIPEYARGGFVRDVDEEGRPEIFNAAKLLPQSVVAEAARAIERFPSPETTRFMNPVVSEAVRIPMGLNFTGRPASAPNVFTDYDNKRYYMNPQTEQAELLGLGELPPGEGLNYLGSQILRNFTKAGALERWLPTRPYDTRIFSTDPSRPPKPEDYILHNLGFGSAQRGARVPELDQAGIQRRYNRRRELQQ